MKYNIKKVLSLLMALAIVCSLAVVPASAAREVSVEVQVSEGSGSTYIVDVALVSDGELKTNAFNSEIEYDPEVLEYVSYSNPNANLMGASNADGGDPNGNMTFGVMGMADVSASNGRLPVYQVVFRVKSGVESQTTNVTAKFTTLGSVASGAYAGVPFETMERISVKGSAPALNTVEVEAPAKVNGQEQTVQATARGGKANKDVTTMVAWSISPASDDVTIDASTGVITIAGNAKNGEYTVTAIPDGATVSGAPKTATLTVARADAVATLMIEGPATITVPKEAGKTTSANYKALLTNQFGDEPVKTDGVTWSVSTAEGVEIDAATGVVTVTSAAAPKTNITITATKGELTKTLPVRLVDIEASVTAKTDAAYGDTWAEILPVSGMTAKMGDQNLTITSAARTIKGQNVDSVKPVPGTYSVDVTINTAEGEATVAVPVTVGKRAITVKLENQTFAYDGEEHAAGNVTAKGDVANEELVCVPVKEIKAKDAGTYEVEYTCESDLYSVTVKGGALVIKPKAIEVTDKSPLESIKLFGDTKVECTIDKKTGNVMLEVTVSPDNVKSETRVIDMLEDATGDVKLAIRVDGTKYEYTIKGWALKDEEFKSGKTNTFVATGFEPVKGGVAGNYAPDLGEIEFVVRVSRSNGGGVSGGASTGWDWGDRGNQTINLTPQSLFTDVPDGHTFQKDIVWVYYRGVMKGTSATTFSPASSTNRQQLWMVLGRISGSSPADMAMAREWAVNTGVSDGSKPTSSLTRQQMVTMLYRWAQSKGYVGVTTGNIAGYNDASSVASYAKDAMAWAVGNGIINGSGNNLNPGGTATRGQFAAIMHRFCERFGV